MPAAGSSNSMSSINSGITGMDRGFRFQTEPEGPGAMGSYLRAQGPLDMVESGRLSLEWSRAWSNSTNAGTTLSSIYLVNVIERCFLDYVNISSISSILNTCPHTRGVRGLSVEKCQIFLLILYIQHLAQS